MRPTQPLDSRSKGLEKRNRFGSRSDPVQETNWTGFHVYKKGNSVFLSFFHNSFSLYKAEAKNSSHLSLGLVDRRRWRRGGWRFLVRWPVSHHGGVVAPETSNYYFFKIFSPISSSPSSESVLEIIFRKGWGVRARSTLEDPVSHFIFFQIFSNKNNTHHKCSL